MIFNNHKGVYIGPVPGSPNGVTFNGVTLFTADAAGESITVIGKINLESGMGSSKVISSAGGKVFWSYLQAITFANAGTNLRIGIQDVGVTGIEDGTFDVYADLVGGTDVLGLNQLLTTPMESGTKTINHGDLIAVSFELTSRAGADSVQFVSMNSITDLFPYATIDTGAGPAKSTTNQLQLGIEFDDGTLGWFDNNIIAYCGDTPSFNSGSTPDERGVMFTAEETFITESLYITLGSISSTDTFDIVIYEDPINVASILLTTTYNPVLIGNAASVLGTNIKLSSDFTFTKGVSYGIVIKPTSLNSISHLQYNFNTGNSNLKKCLMYSDWSLITRTNGGSFSETDTIVPSIGFFAKEIVVASDGGSGICSFS
jgi:hypothetical protein